MKFLNFSEIAWKNENSNEGFLIPWGKIVVTAISQDPQRCIYFMIDSKWSDSNEEEPAEADSNGTEANGGNDEEEGSETESEQAMTEFWLVPESEDDVDNIYYFMSKYPAANDSMDDSDDEFFDGENMEQMNINDDNES